VYPTIRRCCHRLSRHRNVWVLSAWGRVRSVHEAGPKAARHNASDPFVGSPSRSPLHRGAPASQPSPVTIQLSASLTQEQVRDTGLGWRSQARKEVEGFEQCSRAIHCATSPSDGGLRLDRLNSTSTRARRGPIRTFLRACAGKAKSTADDGLYHATSKPEGTQITACRVDRHGGHRRFYANSN
jgi:hypothetical protein